MSKNKKMLTKSVDINNEFWYNNSIFKINKDLESYKVHNTPKKLSNDKYNEWTNEAQMDTVFIIEDGEDVHFLDQLGRSITEYVSKQV